MTSNEQERIIEERINKIIKNYYKFKSIKELSNYLKISTSTIQRDLNKEKKIISLSGINVYKNIQKWLKESKKYGLIKGGKSSQNMYLYERDNDGKYKGIIK